VNARPFLLAGDGDNGGMPSSLPASAEPVASPCVGHCTLDSESVCLGCGRHINEIMAWPAVSDAVRQDIRQRAEARRRARQTPD
jgi:uncharacterized protein